MVFIHVYQIQSERCCNVYLVYHINNHGHEIKNIVMTSLDCKRFFAIASYAEYEIRCIDVHLLIYLQSLEYQGLIEESFDDTKSPLMSALILNSSSGT